MKKIMILTVSLVAALCACTKQQPASIDGVQQVITAYVNAGTKVAYTDNGKPSGATTVWEAGDTFLAIQDGSKVVTFTLTSGEGTTSAEFTATTSGVTSSTTWKAVLGGAAVDASPKISCIYTGQTGKLEDLDNFAYFTAESTGLTPSFDFSSGKALSYVYRVILPAGIKTVDYCTTAGWTVSETKEDVAYDKEEEGSYEETLKNSIFELASPSAAGDVVYIAVPAMYYGFKKDNYASGQQWANVYSGFTITLLNNTTALANQSGGTFVTSDLTSKGGMMGDLDLQTMPLIQRPTIADAIRVQRGASGSNSISWGANKKMLQYATSLDTYWAPYNIGATAENEIGNYYSYGETLTRTNYSFPNYSMRSGAPASSSTNHYYAIASHISNGSTIDFYSIAGSRFDVARVKWGSAWRMPYTIECHALYNYVYTAGATEYVERATVGGKDGTKFLQVTGGSGYLFFPDSGHYEEAALKDENQACWRSADQKDNLYTSSGTKTTDYDLTYVFRSPYSSSTIADGGGKDRAKWAVPVRAVLASSVWNK